MLSQGWLPPQSGAGLGFPYRVSVATETLMAPECAEKIR